MGCFLGCFGGAKDHKRRRQRVNKGSPQRQRNRIQNVQQENIITAEQSITETTSLSLDSELRIKPEGVELLSSSPKRKVTYNSDVTTYDHVSIQESIDSHPDCAINAEKEKPEDLTTLQRSHSLSEENNSVITSVGLYPPNHRYHNARESDDEDEEYGGSDLDYLNDNEDGDRYDEYDEDCEERVSAHDEWPKSFTAESMELRIGNHSPQAADDNVESSVLKSEPADCEVEGFGSKTNARDGSDYVHSVLNPVKNATQWKSAKSKGHSLKPQKENLTVNLDAPRISFSSEPTLGQPRLSCKEKSDQLKNSKQEVAIDASLSNWLVSSERKSYKKTNFGGLETIVSGQTLSEGHTSAISYDDRPILGALTVDELKQMSTSPSPRKSPSRSPDEMPIIGTVGTYWNHLGLAKNSCSVPYFNGTPNTRSSKYRGGI